MSTPTKATLKKQLKAGSLTKAQYDNLLRKHGYTRKSAPKSAPRANQRRVRSQRNPMSVATLSDLSAANSSAGRYVNRQFTDAKGLYSSAGLVPRDPLRAYLASLVNPEKYKARYPDAYARRTALFRSIAQYSIPLNYNATLNQGRFSALIQPSFGSTQLQGYQIAMAKVDAANWDVADWSLASNYQGPNVDGDPRFDANYYNMQGSPAGMAVYNAAAVASSLSPFAGLTAGASNFGPQPSFPLDGAVFDEITIPPGQWSLSILFYCGVTAAPVNLAWKQTATAVTALTISDSSNLCSTPSNGGFFVAAYTAILTATSSSSSLFKYTISDSLGNALVNINNAMITIRLSPAVTGPVPPQTGFIERLRPVSQSALVTYMGPDLLNGGQVTMAYVDPDYANSNFFKSAAIGGQAQSYNALSKVNSDAYNGRLSEGAYGWWSPSANTDMSFMTPADNANADFPVMIVSGAFTPASSLAGAADGTVRLRVCTVWEFTTESTAWDAQQCIGSSAIIDSVYAVLSNQDHTMPNATHESWMDSLLGDLDKGLRFVDRNKSTIGSIAGGLLPLML